MSLELINVGAEANDGTGDTPRAGGVKMNAAIAVVNTLAAAPAPVDYSAAIAGLETTQGTQSGAIAALALDVSALETSQAGQDNVIAALVAAPPVLSAINYDQIAEPSNPVVGQVWRERASNGAILKDWEWSGSLWLSQIKEKFENPKIIVSANATFNLPTYFYHSTPGGAYRLFIQNIIYSFVTDAEINASNFFTLTPHWYRHDGVAMATIPGTNPITHNSLAIYGILTASVDINQILSVGTSIYPGVGFKYEKTGGVQIWFSQSVNYRLMR